MISGKEIQRARVEKDTWKLLKEQDKKHGPLILSNTVAKSKTDSYPLFLKICANNIPKILYVAKIVADLQVTVFFHKP